MASRKSRGSYPPNPKAITSRERAVLAAVSKHSTNAEIAASLSISRRTVESHVASLLRKFGVSNRRDLGAAADIMNAGSATQPTDERAGSPRMPVNLAVLDRRGRITSVNLTWTRFCLENGGRVDKCGVGISYLEVWDRAGDRDSQTVAGYIRAAILGGVSVPYRLRIPCDSPTEPRLFDLLVSSRVDDAGECTGATVSSCPSDANRFETVGSVAAG